MTRGSGECCELPVGSGRSPSRCSLVYFQGHRRLLFAPICFEFVKQCFMSQLEASPRFGEQLPPAPVFLCNVLIFNSPRYANYNLVTSRVQVRTRCEPILQRFNFHWPSSLDCDGLPSHSTREDLCIEPPGEHDHFPDDNSEFEVAPDLLEHAAGMQTDF